MLSPLERAIEICGSQTELARRVSRHLPDPIVSQHVWNWVNRAEGKVPAECCRAIEAATEGRVTRYELRPDVFGSAQSTAA